MSNAVSFVDHSERIIELIKRKVGAGVQSSARVLAEEYQTGLTAEQSPEHSAVGQIPHQYVGHREGGFGPLLGFNEIQNVTFFGFSRDQSEPLAESIQSGVAGNERGVVGFADSHVTERQQNYLIQWDQGTVPLFRGVRRPWIIPLYNRAKTAMISAFKSSFMAEK